MRETPLVGMTGTQQFVVEAKHAIDFANDTMPAVLCTPWLVWFLEHSARNTMLPLLEPHESTVGVQVDVNHLAPTPLGHTVECRARILNVEGTLISFQIEAHDEDELIARCFHRLRVIHAERFAKRVQAKTRDSK